MSDLVKPKPFVFYTNWRSLHTILSNNTKQSFTPVHSLEHDPAKHKTTNFPDYNLTCQPQFPEKYHNYFNDRQLN